MMRRILAACLLVMLLLTFTTAVFAAEPGNTDVSKLENLLAIVNNLRQSDYTAESWSALRKAVAMAGNAVEGSQEEVDKAVADLATALSKLVSMDYSAMEEAIAQAEQYLQANGQQWQQLQSALAEAKTLYGCGDQAAVDRVAEQIRSGTQALHDGVSTEQPAEEKNSAVVWIVLLSISLLGNAALVTHMVWKKKESRKQQIDDVPLVDYDIDDDVV